MSRAALVLQCVQTLACVAEVVVDSIATLKTHETQKAVVDEGRFLAETVARQRVQITELEAENARLRGMVYR